MQEGGTTKIAEMIEGMAEHAAAPRPLALHLAIQNLMYAGSLGALKSLKTGSAVWNGSLTRQASHLRESLQNVDPDKFSAALNREIAGRMAAFAEGVNRFAAAPREAAMPALAEVWREGTTRLLHAPAHASTHTPAHTSVPATPVILVPSLVNRAYILDLDPDHSLVRYLAGCGFDAYLVDWDAPGETEMSFSIDDYVGRLERVRDFVRETTGETPVVAGYCMGGNLALALAHRAPQKTRALALLATPWDFHAMPVPATQMLAAMMPGLRHLIDAVGNLPVDVIQAMFSSRDPGGVIRK